MSESPDSPGWILRQFGTADRAEPVSIEPGQIVKIGRSADNDVVLADPGVSSHHMILRLESAHLVVEDLSSLNGTFVDGERVEKRALDAGQMVRAGADGPGFIVDLRVPLEGTVVTSARRRVRRSGRFGTGTIAFLRDALGVTEEAQVEEIVERETRRSRRTVVVALVGVVAGLIAGFVWLRSQSSEEVEALARDVEERLAGTATRFAELQTTWEQQRDRLREEERTLTARLQVVERDEAASSGEITRLQEQLSATTAKLQQFDPVELEQRQLHVLEDVRRAVVFVETRITMHDTKTGDTLMIVEDSGSRRFGFDSEGEAFTRDGSGSGFVVSPEGWILTNAHVVRPDGHDTTLTLPDGRVVESKVGVAVVFDGEEKRHDAEVVRWIHDRDVGDDFALIKIEPFEGMAHIGDFRTDRERPDTGTNVFLFGYPFGTMAIQPDNRVVGSTFRGILSRHVDTWLQVDAAVHPGNSGGPVTDRAGNVIGIATAVQRTPDGQITPAMGYVIPVGALVKVWPPPK